MPRLTKKQMKEREDKLLVEAYNMQYNEIFKLHHFLVDCEYTNHSIDSGNPIDDAIELIEKLIEEQWK